MVLDLFAGVHVRDFESAKGWYIKLFGSEPSFLAHETEAVWQVAEHRFIFIEEAAEHAGHAEVVAFVDDIEGLVAEIAGRGIEPSSRETYDNGVRKVLYQDPDGNQIGFGGAPGGDQ